jgi:hypothetical protein
MIELARWPAGRGADPPPRASAWVLLEYQLGVWGKAPGAPTDFRWLARSAPLPPELPRSLVVGSEREPFETVVWRHLGGRYCAAHLYPSSAVDATGRTSFLEKTLMLWRGEPGVPLVWAALALLPHVANSRGEHHWRSVSLEHWRDETFFVTLDQDTTQPLEVFASDLDGALELGLAELADAVDETALTQAYGVLETGEAGPTALLRGCRGPLSPRALAVLLLPFERPRADELSLVGWMPDSGRGPSSGTRWDLCATGGVAVRAEGRSQDLAHRRARALLEKNPALLVERASVTLEGLRLGSVGSPGCDGSRDGAASGYPDETVEGCLPARSPALHGDTWPTPDTTLELGPRPLAGGALELLYDYARRIRRRWLEPRDLRAVLMASDPQPPQASETVLRWAEIVEGARPEHVDQEHWQVKVETLRLAAGLLSGEQPGPRLDGVAASRWLPQWERLGRR